MPKTVEGIYRVGKVELLEIASSVKDGARVLITFLAENSALYIKKVKSLLDNLNVHKASEIADEVARRWARTVWLPPDAADYRPIEHCWSKLKASLRRLKARTYEQLNEALKTAHGLITESLATDGRQKFIHLLTRLAARGS